MNNYTSICICIHVSIPDCYMNTIDDKQNEKYFNDHYNEFEYNHDFQLQTIT